MTMRIKINFLVPALLLIGLGVGSAVVANTDTDAAKALLREIIECAKQAKKDKLLKGYEVANITRPANHALRDLRIYEQRLKQGRDEAAQDRYESYLENLDKIDEALDEINKRPEREEFVEKIRALLNEIRNPSTSLAIVEDNFNDYTNGSVVGQGGWESYVNGENFIVQDAVTNEGDKALHISALADSVATKKGTPRSDGRQAVYVRTENRSSWGPYPDGNAQFRVTKNSWAGGTDIFAAVTFKSDGNVAYFDPISESYQDFDTYNDNEWTLLEIEWRSSDKMARYRMNEGTWTDWKTFKGAASFTDFDYVGFDFILPSGSGGVRFDTLK
ncbi:MAG: hypothetical protein UW94_C0006G0031 [Parcubacteria group bacterium GW2011_GWA2_45_14]|nr:MAG: hypothetical protein UW94_C0006G0031 [Parcubacteria group bacterium GW2011_GWA2_45_14]